MTDNKHETRNNAIAAGIIMLAAGCGIYFLPTVVLGIGRYSPALGFAAGCAIILAFFLVFWLRARFKR